MSIFLGLTRYEHFLAQRALPGFCEWTGFLPPRWSEKEIRLNHFERLVMKQADAPAFQHSTGNKFHPHPSYEKK
jgi:hypothetical protein